jgi:hypothetical protein
MFRPKFSVFFYGRGAGRHVKDEANLLIDQVCVLANRPLPAPSNHGVCISGPLAATGSGRNLWHVDVAALILGAFSLTLLVWIHFYYARLKLMSPRDPSEHEVKVYIGGGRLSHKLIMSAVTNIRERQCRRKVG